MIEFGSYFHSCDIKDVKNPNYFSKKEAINYYESGRHAFGAIIKQEKWERIWIPGYFCYEVVDFINSLGIKIKFYDDNPLKLDDSEFVEKLPYLDKDVLLRVNYFGLRSKRSNNELNIPVIEDHTHAINSEWAMNSDADWCVASLRKSYPIAGGGILWSPKNKSLPIQIETSSECEKIAKTRFEAMKKKAFYLNNGGDKNEFREKFILTENMIGTLPFSGMDSKSFQIIQSMDIEEWTYLRKKNWDIAYKNLSEKFNILTPPNNDSFCPLSLVILCNSYENRNLLRQYMMSHSIFPAILWDVPESCEFSDAVDFSKKMLSIHCDARYTTDDIKKMCKIINEFYD